MAEKMAGGVTEAKTDTLNPTSGTYKVGNEAGQMCIRDSIGAAQEDLAAPERGISPSGSSARSSEKDGAKAAPRRSRTHEVRSASLDVTQAAAMPDFFAEDYT